MIQAQPNTYCLVLVVVELSNEKVKGKKKFMAAYDLITVTLYNKQAHHHVIVSTVA